MKKLARKIKGFNDEPAGEICQRCRVRGEDRRTIRQAALYDLTELGIPFERSRIHGYYCEQNGMSEMELFGRVRKIPQFTEPDLDQDARNFDFFNLRVCKECRAEWMEAIKQWFNAVPDKPASYGSDI